MPTTRAPGWAWPSCSSWPRPAAATSSWPPVTVVAWWPPSASVADGGLVGAVDRRGHGGDDLVVRRVGVRPHLVVGAVLDGVWREDASHRWEPERRRLG